MATTETQCHFCPVTQARMVNGCHWTGTEYIRADICDACYADGGKGCKLAKAPRKPRQRRTAATIPASDWNMLVAFTKGAQR